VLGTLGKLGSWIKAREKIDLSHVRMVIVDEANEFFADE
jgi:superfamily II DNA/RNA helicase